MFSQESLTNPYAVFSQGFLTNKALRPQRHGFFEEK